MLAMPAAEPLATIRVATLLLFNQRVTCPLRLLPCSVGHTFSTTCPPSSLLHIRLGLCQTPVDCRL
jgi:hypothetical protein